MTRRAENNFDCIPFSDSDDEEDINKLQVGKAKESFSQITFHSHFLAFSVRVSGSEVPA